VDQGIFKRDRVALAKLFHAASSPKRSKIGSFVRIVRALDPHLRFPTALNERVGLALAQALEADSMLGQRIYEDIEHNLIRVRKPLKRSVSAKRGNALFLPCSGRLCVGFYGILGAS